MKEEKTNDVEKEPIKIGINELCIGIAVVIILILVFNSSSLKNTFRKDEYETEDYSVNEKQYEELTELEKNGERLECFDFSISKLENSSVAVVLKNTSTLPLSNLELHIILYDGEERPIKVKTEYIDCILPEEKWAGEIYDVPNNYETYDYLVEANNYNIGETVELFKNISITQVFGKDTNMSVRVENKFNKKISASVTALYFDKNGNIADIERFYAFDIKPNKSIDVEAYKYLDNKQRGNTGVEIILTNAYEE